MRDFEFIARIVYTAMAQAGLSLQGAHKVPWLRVKPEDKLRLVARVREIVDGSVTSPEAAHNSWLKDKQDRGWKQGSLNEDMKQSPNIVSFKMLKGVPLLKINLFFRLATELLACEPKSDGWDVFGGDMARVGERTPRMVSADDVDAADNPYSDIGPGQVIRRGIPLGVDDFDLDAARKRGAELGNAAGMKPSGESRPVDTGRSGLTSPTVTISLQEFNARTTPWNNGDFEPGPVCCQITDCDRVSNDYSMIREIDQVEYSHGAENSPVGEGEPSAQHRWRIAFVDIHWFNETRFSTFRSTLPSEPAAAKILRKHLDQAEAYSKPFADAARKPDLVEAMERGGADLGDAVNSATNAVDRAAAAVKVRVNDVHRVGISGDAIPSATMGQIVDILANGENTAVGSLVEPAKGAGTDLGQALANADAADGNLKEVIVSRQHQVALDEAGAILEEKTFHPDEREPLPDMPGRDVPKDSDIAEALDQVEADSTSDSVTLPVMTADTLAKALKIGESAPEPTQEPDSASTPTNDPDGAESGQEAGQEVESDGDAPEAEAETRSQAETEAEER